MTALAAFFCGLIFAFGLGLSGMTQPAKVVGFLDFTGAWDPSLAMVMIGAIAVHSLSYRSIVRRPSPLLAESFRLPSASAIDHRLLVGAALFGVGWGLVGYCPGPAVTAVGGASRPALLFVPAMMAGIALYHFLLGGVRSEPSDG